MYIQFIERMRTRQGFRAQLAGPDEREILIHETLIGLKTEVLAAVDIEDTPHVESLFAAFESKEHRICDSNPS